MKQEERVAAALAGASPPARVLLVQRLDALARERAAAPRPRAASPRRVDEVGQQAEMQVRRRDWRGSGPPAPRPGLRWLRRSVSIVGTTTSVRDCARNARRRNPCAATGAASPAASPASSPADRELAGGEQQQDRRAATSTPSATPSRVRLRQQRRGEDRRDRARSRRDTAAAESAAPDPCAAPRRRIARIAAARSSCGRPLSIR